MHLKASKSSQSGAALVTAIVFTAIFATLMAGIAVFAAGHYSLATRESDNAAALQLADAGINYEVRYISANQFASGFTVHGTSNPDAGSISGVPGSFSVWVTTNSGGAWNNTDGNNMLLTATGTVNGITRKVQAEGYHGADLFDNYAVFGINSVNFNGSKALVTGDLGTNGSFSGSSSDVTGTIYLDGSSASGVTGTNVVKNPDAVTWPTTDQIVTNTFSGPPSGWSWISAHNNNANARTYKSGSSWPTAPSASNTQVLAVAGNTIPKHGNTILPPGDYYITSMDLNGQGVLIADDAGLTTGTPGVVRIWMPSTGSGTMQNAIYFTSTNPQMFQMYSDAGISISGDTSSGGSFYGHSTTSPVAFTITGNSTTYASIIADSVTISGNSAVAFPSNAGTGSTQTQWLWWGIDGGWKELPGGSGVVFDDGTSS